MAIQYLDFWQDGIGLKACIFLSGGQVSLRRTITVNGIHIAQKEEGHASTLQQFLILGLF